LLFPIRLDDAVMKTEEGVGGGQSGGRGILGIFGSGKVTTSIEEAFGRLMRDLKAGKGERKITGGGRKTKARWRRKVGATLRKARWRRKVAATEG